MTMYIKKKLEELNYKKTTPIQDGVFKAFTHKKHMVGLAPTGTGKTHAYLLPLFEQIKNHDDQLHAIVLVPTNELVVQVYQMAKDVDQEISIKAYYGGSDKQKEALWLKKNTPQVMITTPERLNYFLVTEHVLNLKQLKYLILDEADMMFDYDFLSMIDVALTYMQDTKYFLFSATITKAMEPFIKKYFGQYDFIDTTKAHQLDITYYLIHLKYQDRLTALLKLTEHINPFLCFVFVSKKDDQQPIYDAFLEKGLNAVMLSSNIPFKVRKKRIEDIKDLKYTYVITSDIAARGLDFKISHVIHYDLPYHLEFFMHRSGRTGRMYESGLVYTLITNDDTRKIDKLRQKGIPFESYEMTNQGLKHVQRKQKEISEAEKIAIKKVKKPTRVKPNYKKKYQEQVKKAKKQARRKQK